MDRIYSQRSNMYSHATSVWKKRHAGDFNASRLGNQFKSQETERFDNRAGRIYSSDVRRRRVSDASRIMFASSGGRDTRGKKKLGESRREASERKRSVLKRKGLRLFFLCLLVFIGLVFLVYKLLFVVESINVEGMQRYKSEEIASASGLVEGINLYSFRSSVVKSRITFNCPYVSDIDLSRDIPDKVTILVQEDSPEYVAEIYGENILLSKSLRMLGKVGKDEIPAGLVRLKLPDIKEAVSGRTLVFFDSKADKAVRSILSAVSDSELSERINTADMRDLYGVSLVCDSKYLLSVGNTDNIALKLKTAAKVLEDDMFAGDDRAKIDLKMTGKTSVTIDNKLDLD